MALKALSPPTRERRRGRGRRARRCHRAAPWCPRTDRPGPAAGRAPLSPSWSPTTAAAPRRRSGPRPRAAPRHTRGTPPGPPRGPQARAPPVSSRDSAAAVCNAWLLLSGFCLSGLLRSGQSLVEVHGHPIADALAELAQQRFRHRQLVRAVAERHERGPDRVAVELGTHLDESAGAEELGRARHLHVGPAARVRLLQDGRGEGVVEPRRRALRRGAHGNAPSSMSCPTPQGTNEPPPDRQVAARNPRRPRAWNRSTASDRGRDLALAGRCPSDKSDQAAHSERTPGEDLVSLNDGLALRLHASLELRPRAGRRGRI